MRQHPVGTGPFKFGAFKPNEYIKVTRNADYWKQGRPYLDGIDYTIIKNLSTANLAFIAGKFDMTFPYALSVPLLKDVNSRMPQAICELTPTAVNRNLIINRDLPSLLTTRTCGGRWRSAWTAKRLSTSLVRDRATLAASCSLCRKGSGARHSTF
jgi:hypothetical protein